MPLEVKAREVRELKRKASPETAEEFRKNAPEIFEAEDAAKFLGVEIQTLRALTNSGALPCRRVGRKRLYGKRALVDWVNSGWDGGSEN